MFDLETFVLDCTQAVAAAEPLRAVREVLGRAVAEPSRVAGALEHSKGMIDVLHRSASLTILNVVWTPGMQLQPHDHRMWAAIGVYAGQEDNAFFRREGATLAPSGGKELCERDVLLLGDDAIHSVTNPRRSHTGAIHVYGGDFVAQPRSVWDPVTMEEEPFDYERLVAQFDDT